jgi:hypothetical protein
MLEAMKRGIERALLHLQDVARQLLNAARDGPSVLRFELQRFEDQKIEGALDEVDGFDALSP